MKTVGIVTWFGTDNYGSNLQAIGLAAAVRACGYDAFFLEKFKVKSFMLRHPRLLAARLLNRVNEKKRKAFFVPVPYQLSAERKERLRKFKKDNYTARTFEDAADWEKAVSEGTIFAAGSDIVWNPARGYPAVNFLDFAYYAGLPRFSYASSIGALELPRKYYRAYRRYLGSLEEISVREQAAADMLEPVIGRKATRVADPSLLLSAGEWDALADKAELSVTPSPGGYILCYFVMQDPRYWAYMKLAQSKTGLQVIVLPMHDLDEQQPYEIVRDGTPYEFVRLIRDASLVCTDSFHACVLSLIYEKEFYLLRRARKAEDAKYDDFLGRYRLGDRAVRDETVFERKDVDYSFAREELARDREFSFAFLKKALAECAAKGACKPAGVRDEQK